MCWTDVNYIYCNKTKVFRTKLQTVLSSQLNINFSRWYLKHFFSPWKTWLLLLKKGKNAFCIVNLSYKTPGYLVVFFSLKLMSLYVRGSMYAISYIQKYVRLQYKNNLFYLRFFLTGDIILHTFTLIHTYRVHLLNPPNWQLFSKTAILMLFMNILIQNLHVMFKG